MPLTRLAWLSAFLNMGKTSICYLDPMGRLAGLEELKDLYRSNFYDFIGVADSGLGLCLDWVVEEINPRIVILDQHPSETEKELEKLGAPRTNYAELLHEELAKHKGSKEVLWVPDSLLTERRVVEKVFWHLLPGQAFDEVRFNEFVRYEIALNKENTAKNAIERRKVFGDLLRDFLPRVREKGSQNVSSAALH
jgi:hypothetical protein